MVFVVDVTASFDVPDDEAKRRQKTVAKIDVTAETSQKTTMTNTRRAEKSRVKQTNCERQKRYDYYTLLCKNDIHPCCL